MSKAKTKRSLASPVGVQHDDWRKRLVLTIDEVREILRVSQPHAYRIVAKSHLPSFKVGGAIRIRVSDVVRLIDGQRTAA